MRTWRTLEGGLARARMIVGVALVLALILIGLAATTFLVWLWRLVRG